MIEISFKRSYAAGYMLLAWATLALQFILMIDSRVVSIPLTILRFFSFFTILCNLLAALVFTGMCLPASAGRFKLFTSQGARTAITLYMLVVGIIYNTVLRSLWQPKGLHYIADESLHLILPLLCLLGWVLLVPKNKLQWRMAFTWLWFPFFYILLLLVEGAITGWYPYPFADAAVLGYSVALLNGLLILIGSLVFGIIFIALGRLISAAARR
jgi:hypothetical protein